MRRTVARPASSRGIGLHLGVPCTLDVPAGAAGSGHRLPATGSGRGGGHSGARRARGADRASHAAGRGADAVHTVEHVLAAVRALGHRRSGDRRWTAPSRRSWTAVPGRSSMRWRRRASRSRPAEFERRGSRRRCAWWTASRSTRRVRRTSSTLDVTIDFPHPLIGAAAVHVSRDDARRSRVSWRGRARSGSCARWRRCGRRG